MPIVRNILTPHRRLLLSLALIPPTAIAVLIAPFPAALLLLIVVALLLIERARREQRMYAAATILAGDDPEAKLEVTEGGWGALCHAINRMLQQRRAQQYLLRRLPTPPAMVARRLGELTVPLEGLSCMVAVLVIGPQPSDDPAARLQEVAAVAHRQAEAHGALMSRAGERIMLIFGAVGPSGPSAHLRSALGAAQALYAAWPDPAERPALSLASGQARAIILPGLGFTVLGPPVEQALAAQSAGPTATLACSEEVYLQLRRIGGAPALGAEQRRARSDGSMVYAVPLA